MLEEYITETDIAQFSVFGTMPDGTMTNTIYSDVFIVDNVAPVETHYEVTLVNGLFRSYIVINVDNAKDLIDFEYLYQTGKKGALKALKNNKLIIGSKDEAITLYARDALGNLALVDSISFDDYRTMPAEKGYIYGSLLAGILLIILLLRYRNIKFEFIYADGKTKTVRYYRRYKNNGIDVKLKDKWLENVVSAEMTMKKRITEKMLGNIVRITNSEIMIKAVDVPKNLSSKFSEKII